MDGPHAYMHNVEVEIPNAICARNNVFISEVHVKNGTGLSIS